MTGFRKEWNRVHSIIGFLLCSLVGAYAVEPVASPSRVTQFKQPKAATSKPVRAPKIKRIPPPKESFRNTSLNGPEIKDWIDEIDLHSSKPVKVFLDAGHGGKDEGAQGHFQTSEKEIVLSIAKKVRTRLKDPKKKILFMSKLSREKDEFISLRERIRKANEWGADVFISIHANASVYQTPKGFEVYFLNAEPTDSDTRLLTQIENEGHLDESLKTDVLNILSDVSTMAHIEESARLANVLYEEMSKVLEPNKRGVKQGPFTVLSGTQMPAVLLEVGYVTNPKDAQLLARDAYLNKLADAVSKGILKYLEQLQSLS